MDKEELLKTIKELCQRAGEGEFYAEAFWKELCQDAEVYQEFVFYAENGTFACKAAIKGYTVVDILVWQMDHFKAWMDRDNSGRKNADKMLLSAFWTFLKMKKEPETYIQKMQYETGTDYPEKF